MYHSRSYGGNMAPYIPQPFIWQGWRHVRAALNLHAGPSPMLSLSIPPVSSSGTRTSPPRPLDINGILLLVEVTAAADCAVFLNIPTAIGVRDYMT